MIIHVCLSRDSGLVVFNSLVGIKFNLLTPNSNSTLAATEACAFLFLFLENKTNHCDGRWHQQDDPL